MTSSKFGLHAGGSEVHDIKEPGEALALIQAVVEQFLGDSWTTYQPRCPICNSGLCDQEKHMNRPVGECTNKKCNSSIHPADYFGKIQDILAEWDICKEDWKEKLERRVPATKQYTGGHHAIKPAQKPTKTGGYTSDEEFIEKINGEPVFLW